MTTPTPGLLPGIPLGMLRIHRGELIAVSIIGVILGLVGLFLPGVTLLTVAIIFGSYLIVSGIFRITAAFVSHGLTTGLRWLTGIMGLIVIVAGIICLADPFGSLVVLAFVIGIGWIAEGITDVIGGLRGSVRPRWFGIVSGVISILAGIVTFVLPALAVVTFVTIASVLLIVVSLSTLFTLPRRNAAATSV
ncbi:MAG TPA: DUF308 domain-containing protein [Lacisediminihabitans sp.]|uniref:HdeD family acid-resistance protein n=1 Tax=Lacisediminihabitans sp. TaxID=2787631 RepID=UPI002ED8F6C6